MHRVVEPEWLDQLPADDPRAVSARRDLRRLNSFMGSPWLMARAIHGICGERRTLTLAEIGCGDGDFSGRVVKRLSRCGIRGRAVMVDRESLPAPGLKERFAAAGWEMEWIREDAFTWLANQPPHRLDVLTANLFLHHFDEAALRELLKLYAHAAKAVVAIETRRWRPALFFSRLTGLIGCTAVTRHDSVLSVQAGFAGSEITPLWPTVEGWRLEESDPTWASHRFVACRTDWK